MTDDPNQVSKSGASIGDQTSRKVVSAAARRRLLKGGVSAAPVILTLTSRPVLGFENACLSPSRMISGNHSGFAGPITCGGETLAFYEAQAKQNQPPPWATLFFTSVFGTGYPYDSTAPGDPKKLGPVFLDSYAGYDGNANSTSGFACYIIAAYLNALNNVGSVSSVLTSAQVVSMWNDVIGTGQYCPQISMCWNAKGVIGYFQHSGIVPS